VFAADHYCINLLAVLSVSVSTFSVCPAGVSETPAGQTEKTVSYFIAARLMTDELLASLAVRCRVYLTSRFIVFCLMPGDKLNVMMTIHWGAHVGVSRV